MAKGLSVEESWAEALLLFFLVVGLLISLGMRLAIFSYISVSLSGALAARIYYQRRYREPILPFILIIIGFLLGYLVGGFGANRFLLILYFVLGFALSYYLHLRKIFVIFKSDGFIK